MEGDQTGQELLEEALRVLDPDVTGLPLEIERHDLSLENRRRTRNQVVFDAAEAVVAHGFGLKAATITPEGAEDVGSPNALLREAIGGKVIIRSGRRLSGVRPIGGIHAPISIVRMAVDDAYNAREYREGEGDEEVAWRVERISRRTCRAVAEFAFQQARRMHATVFGGPKWTVSPVYEGMLKEELDAAAARHPDVRYRPILIDALYAALISHSGDALVVPALNRDGDCLSDMVLQLFGSIAGAESQLLAFDEDFRASAVMAEAPHGTAPTLQGKNVANPLAMILAGASVLPYMQDEHASVVSRAIYEGALEAIAEDVRTADLGGPRGHRRVHRRGHQARPDQARRLGRPRRERAALLSLGRSGLRVAVARPLGDEAQQVLDGEAPALHRGHQPVDRGRVGPLHHVRAHRLVGARLEGGGGLDALLGGLHAVGARGSRARPRPAARRAWRPRPGSPRRRAARSVTWFGPGWATSSRSTR